MESEFNYARQTQNSVALQAAASSEDCNDLILTDKSWDELHLQPYS